MQLEESTVRAATTVPDHPGMVLGFLSPVWFVHDQNASSRRITVEILSKKVYTEFMHDSDLTKDEEYLDLEKEFKLLQEHADLLEEQNERLQHRIQTMMSSLAKANNRVREFGARWAGCVTANKFMQVPHDNGTGKRKKSISMVAPFKDKVLTKAWGIGWKFIEGARENERARKDPPKAKP